MSSTARNSLKLSFLTIISRILGLARDHFQAVFFGTGPIAFAWEIAILLPGVLRSVLVEGGISQAFIPVYTSFLERSREEAKRTAGVILFVVFVIMVICTLLTFWASPYILSAMTRQSLAEADFMIRLSWILMLFMLPASITAILAGLSNAHQHFVVPALSPIVLNVALVIGFLSLDIGAEAMGNAKTLAWFFVSSAVFQLLLQYIYVWSHGFSPRPCLDLKHPAVRKIFQMVIPAFLSTALFSINQLVDVAIASYFTPPEMGGVPALRFSQRLVLLPTGIIGVALSTAILPILARCLEKGTKKKEEEIMDSFHFAAFLTFPASLGFFFLGEDIITMLFHGGNWDRQSTQVTWEALRYYLLGIPLYSLNKILLSIFFAFRDTRTPLRSMILSISCNFVMNLIFVHVMQHAGIALSTALSAGIYFAQLLFYLRKKHIALTWGPVRAFLGRTLPLWLCLVGFLAILDAYLSEPLYHTGRQLARALGLEEKQSPPCEAFVKVLVGVGGGFLLYMYMAFLTKTKEMRVFLDFFKRK